MRCDSVASNTKEANINIYDSCERLLSSSIQTYVAVTFDCFIYLFFRLMFAIRLWRKETEDVRASILAD